MNRVYKRYIIYYVEFIKGVEAVINSQSCYMFPFCFLKINHLNCNEVFNHVVLQAVRLTYIFIVEYSDHNLLQNSICIELY